MFGTVARINVKAGKEDEVLAMSREWTQTQSSHSGQIAEYIFKLENQSNEYLAIGIFPDREGYYRFAAEPETDQWYRRWRELLEGDPEWNDGEVMLSEVLARI